MAVNCLAPGYIKIFYTANGHDHVMTIPCAPTDDVPNFDMEIRAGGNVDQETGIGELLDVVVPFFETATTFNGWEAYTQADCDSAPVFQNNGVLTSVNGTNVGAAADWYQATLTFKTFLGGRGRFQMMEGAFGANQHLPIVGIGGIVEALSDYLTGTTTWVQARDNSNLKVPINYTTKMNDTLRKKYLLDV